MSKNVLVINGCSGSGKDAFVSLAIQHLTETNRTGLNISSVDKVKMYGARLGWDCCKDAKGRLFLSDLKELSDRYDGTTKYVCNTIETTDHDVYFVMIREGHCIDKLKNVYPHLTTVLLERDDVVQYSNMADSGVYDYTYDYHIDNNGTLEQLQESAQFLMEIITGER